MRTASLRTILSCTSSLPRIAPRLASRSFGASAALSTMPWNPKATPYPSVRRDETVRTLKSARDGEVCVGLASEIRLLACSGAVGVGWDHFAG